ncbi:hypothetical protein [Mycobacterium adipatum]|jgi:hypothetical protein|uniref:hypothetical protein n=1 Tax=Mycobacterium adipatum TaxID=1682113 RepID=UPI0012E6FCAD|nr:hypothetical protein [Mycobacterium adipatum]
MFADRDRRPTCDRILDSEFAESMLMAGQTTAAAKAPHRSKPARPTMSMIADFPRVDSTTGSFTSFCNPSAILLHRSCNKLSIDPRTDQHLIEHADSRIFNARLSIFSATPGTRYCVLRPLSEQTRILCCHNRGNTANCHDRADCLNQALA